LAADADSVQHYDPGTPKTARWIPFAASCEPAPDWIALFDRRDYQALSFLANRTILIMGDSVDRNGLEHFAVMLGLERYSVPYADASQKGKVPEGWDERGIPWVISVPWLDLTFTNGFLYGLVRPSRLSHSPLAPLPSHNALGESLERRWPSTRVRR